MVLISLYKNAERRNGRRVECGHYAFLSIPSSVVRLMVRVLFVDTGCVSDASMLLPGWLVNVRFRARPSVAPILGASRRLVLLRNALASAATLVC